MVKRIVSGIMFTQLLIGMLALSFNIQPVNANITPPEIVYIELKPNPSANFMVNGVEYMFWAAVVTSSPYGTGNMVMIYKNISPGVYNITVYVSPENLLLGEKYGWLTSLVYPLCIEQYDFILEGVQPASITIEETDMNLTVTVSGPISLFITYTPYGDNVTVIEDPDDSPYLYDYDGDGFCSYSIWRACHASGSFNGYPLEPANFNYGGFDIVDYEWYNLGILAPTVVTTVDFAPSTLNLKSKGKWITAYIEPPEGYNVHEINVSTIMLNDTILVEPRPISIGDYDSDSIPDLMIKFDRQAVIQYILNNIDLTELFEERFMRVTLTISGYLYNGTPFQGTDTIRIIMPMPRGLFRIFPI